MKCESQSKMQRTRGLGKKAPKQPLLLFHKNSFFVGFVSLRNFLILAYSVMCNWIVALSEYGFLLLTAWGNLGNVLKSQSKISEAESAYRNALYYRSNMADMLYNL